LKEHEAFYRGPPVGSVHRYRCHRLAVVLRRSGISSHRPDARPERLQRKRLCPPSQPPHEYGPGIRPKDATNKKARTARSRGRSVVVLYNEVRTHLSLKGCAGTAPRSARWTHSLPSDLGWIAPPVSPDLIYDRHTRLLSTTELRNECFRFRIIGSECSGLPSLKEASLVLRRFNDCGNASNAPRRQSGQDVLPFYRTGQRT
jgi:hypothetical protein